MDSQSPTVPETVPDLYRLAFIPGVFRCPMCQFVLAVSTISATTGEIGTTEADRQSEPCPNDGTMMVHVAYREQLAAYEKRILELSTDRLCALESLWSAVKDKANWRIGYNPAFTAAVERLRRLEQTEPEARNDSWRNQADGAA